MMTGKASPGQKPWERLGLSKSTYYRRHGKGGDGVAAPASGRSSTQAAVDRALAKQARIYLEQTLGTKGEDEVMSFTGTVGQFRAVAAVLRKAGS